MKFLTRLSKKQVCLVCKQDLIQPNISEGLKSFASTSENEIIEIVNKTSLNSMEKETFSVDDEISSDI